MRSRRRERLLTAAVLVAVACAGAAASLTGFLASRAREESQARTRFERAAASRAAALQTALVQIQDDLAALGAFLENPLWLARAEFSRVASELRKRRGDTQAFEWIPRVLASERDATERAARAEGLPGFEITERRGRDAPRRAGDRAEYYPVLFVDPPGGNEGAVGYDLGSEAIRREAIERACASRAAVASARVELLQGAPGVLVLQPVWQRADWQRRQGGRGGGACEELLGVVAGVYRVDDLVGEALGSAASRLARERLRVELLDADAGRALLWTDAPLRDGGAPRAPGAALSSEFTLRVADRRWIARFTTPPGYDAGARSWTPRAILVGGLTITSLVIGLWTLVAARAARAREHALRLERDRRRLARETSQRVLAETALHQSEELFRGLAENSPVGVYLLQRGAFRYVNATACALAGSTPAEASAGLRPRRVIDPRDWPGVVRELRRRAPGQRLHLEFRTRARGGASRLLETFAVAAMFGGEPALVGTVVDITDRERLAAAREQRRRDEMLRRVTESSPLPMVIAQGLDGALLLVNEAFEQVFGYSRAELPDLDAWRALAYPDAAYREEVRRGWRARFDARGAAGSWGPLEARVACKDGAIRHVAIHGAYVDALQLLVFVDLTARKQAEQAIRESEQRLSLLVQQSPLGVITWNPYGEAVAWNAAAERIFGYSTAEVLGCPFSLFVPPEQRHLVRWESLRDCAPGYSMVLDAVARDGRTLSCEWHNARLTGEDGKLVGVVSLVGDVTERRRAALELARAKEQAERASEAKGEFLANMSHEIRTPLNAVIGMAGLLLDGALGDEQRRHAETVRTSGEALLAVVNDVLDFSKIEARKLELESVDFDLVRLVDDLAAMMAVRAHEKGLELVCAVAPDVPPLLTGDPGRLRQVLTNLVGNAVKFTARGEVAVRAALEALDGGRAALRFSVRDTGPGIPPEKRELIFESFTQVDASTTRRYGGTGLGLAISRRLVELQGGRIGVAGEPGEGSEFWFTVRLGVRAPDGARAPALPELGGARVLVADGNATARGALAEQLRAWGAEVTEAGDGAAAVRRLDRAAAGEAPFALAAVEARLVDERLAAALEGPGPGPTRCLVLARPADRAAAARLVRAGARAVAKPLRTSELRAALAAALGAGRAAEAEPREAPGAPAAPRGDASVLVVDDNATNQLVAVGMLRRHGLRADAVGSGAEALAALAARPYDLVFMDVQMPGMNGYQATRAIRDPGSAVRDRHVPVVAMTAHALQGDRERCLASGMSDYVAKPVEPRALADVLARWLPPRRAGPDRATGAPPAPGSGAAAVAFDEEGLLARLGGDVELARAVARAFAGDVPAQLRALRERADAGDAPGVERRAHTLKGAAANVGGNALAAVAAELEGRARDRRVDGARDLLAAVEAGAASLASALDAFAARGAGP